MDKKEKDCGYWVAVLLAGLVLGAAAGFVLGWLWKEGPTSPEATKLVDVFIAVGTVGAVIAAVGVALHQNWQRKKDVREDKDERALGSIMLILKALEELKLIHRRADAVFFNKHPNVTELSLTQLKGYLLSLRNLQNIPWYESPYASVYKSFHHAVFSLEDAGVTVEEWLNKMESKSFKVADLKESLSILSFAYKNAEDVYKKEIKSSDFSALPVPDRYYL